MKISRNEALGLTAIGTIAYLAYNLLKSKQELKVKEKQYTEGLQEAVEEVEAEVICHVHDKLINEAVQKAVDKKVNDILSKGTDKAIESAKNRINSEISATIQSYWKSKKDSVSDDILVKVGKLDVDEIREEAVNKARDKAMTSIDSKIDDVISGMQEKADKRIEAAITKAENRIERKSSDMLLDLKSTYNLTRQILNV
jgi:predicted translin family RNA/ssDNA-binding protein